MRRQSRVHDDLHRVEFGLPFTWASCSVQQERPQLPSSPLRTEAGASSSAPARRPRGPQGSQAGELGLRLGITW